MHMWMLALTFVLLGAFAVSHIQAQGTHCSFKVLEKAKSSCMKSIVCGLTEVENDTCSNILLKLIDCVYTKAENCSNNSKTSIKALVPRDLICKFGGVDVRLYVAGTNGSQNASYCVHDYDIMWENDMTDPGLRSQFDEMKVCLTNLLESKECNLTIPEGKLDNPFEDCWDKGSSSVSPHTAHGGSTPTIRPHSLLCAFITMLVLIPALSTH